MRTAIPLTVLATALACSLVSAPAHARARVFVASYGNDANPCTFLSPCRNFQAAVNAVDAGGEVTAIDSAGFGPIDIVKAVTITSPDGVEAGVVPVAGGNAIDINASPSDAIVLRGLTLNGSGIGLNGINFNSGASLTITNCVVQNFVHTAGPGTGNGILIEPTSGPMNFAITNTIISNNGEIGIFYIPASNSVGNGVIDHVVATGNIYGFNVEAPLNGPKGFVAISNSVFSNNVQDGIFDENGVLSIDNVTISGNSNAGIQAVGTTQVLLGRSVIAGNVTGILTDPLSTFTYKDNRINLNGTDVSGTLDTQFVLQ